MNLTGALVPGADARHARLNATTIGGNSAIAVTDDGSRTRYGEIAKFGRPAAVRMPGSLSIVRLMVAAPFHALRVPTDDLAICTFPPFLPSS